MDIAGKEYINDQRVNNEKNENRLNWINTETFNRLPLFGKILALYSLSSFIISLLGFFVILILIFIGITIPNLSILLIVNITILISALFTGISVLIIDDKNCCRKLRDS